LAPSGVGSDSEEGEDSHRIEISSERKQPDSTESQGASLGQSKPGRSI
jgi:hypothetical protein